MELRDYVRVLRKSWPLLVLCVALALGAAAVATWRSTKLYAASVTMVVSSPDANSATAAYQGNLLSQQRVKSYADLLASERVAADVVGRLGLSESPAALRGQISASAVPDTMLLRATVTDRSPRRAQQIADAVGTPSPGRSPTSNARRRAGSRRCGSASGRGPSCPAPPSRRSPHATCCSASRSACSSASAGRCCGPSSTPASRTPTTSPRPRSCPSSARSPSTPRARSARSSCTPARTRHARRRSGSSARTCSSSTSTSTRSRWSSPARCRARARPRRTATWRSRSPRPACGSRWSRATCAARPSATTSASRGRSA